MLASRIAAHIVRAILHSALTRFRLFTIYRAFSTAASSFGRLYMAAPPTSIHGASHASLSEVLDPQAECMAHLVKLKRAKCDSQHSPIEAVTGVTLYSPLTRPVSNFDQKADTVQGVISIFSLLVAATTSGAQGGGRRATYTCY